MLVFFTSRVISSLVAFLYPGYASYKTLSQRPASEEDLERWLMYWCVLGCVVGVEYVAEWAISWIPFYYTLKTLFLLHLALPQTQGSSYLYAHHLQPFFRTHESQIDSALAKFKARLYTFVQQRARMVWDQAAVAMGQPQPQPRGVEDVRPQPSNIGVGPSQLVSNLWTSYGPGILAGGMALIRQTTTTTTSSSGGGAPTTSGSDAGRKRPGASILTTPPGSHMRTGSVDDDGRRQFESSVSNIEGLPVSGSGGTSSSRSSSDSAMRRNVGHRRDRSGSGGSGRFEEVEAPSDVEGYEVDEGYAGTSGTGSGSGGGGGGWFSWGAAAKGYERVKSD